ncbi:MAG: hypothetical protein MZV65_19305 [Chromatiales bacterium]|nr:hypothetical protein [Chromatiales bacterium]
MLGVIAAEVLGFEAHGWVVQADRRRRGARRAALLACTRTPLPRAAGGADRLCCSWWRPAGAAAAASVDPHGAEHLQGRARRPDPRGPKSTQLLPVALAAVLCAGARGSRARHRPARGFYLLFALSVTRRRCSWSACTWCSPASILPALAAVRLRRRPAGGRLCPGGCWPTRPAWRCRSPPTCRPRRRSCCPLALFGGGGLVVCATGPAAELAAGRALASALCEAPICRR